MNIGRQIGKFLFKSSASLLGFETVRRIFFNFFYEKIRDFGNTRVMSFLEKCAFYLWKIFSPVIPARFHPFLKDMAMKAYREVDDFWDDKAKIKYAFDYLQKSDFTFSDKKIAEFKKLAWSKLRAELPSEVRWAIDSLREHEVIAKIQGMIRVSENRPIAARHITPLIAEVHKHEKGKNWRKKTLEVFKRIRGGKNKKENSLEMVEESSI